MPVSPRDIINVGAATIISLYLVYQVAGVMQNQHAELQATQLATVKTLERTNLLLDRIDTNTRNVVVNTAPLPTIVAPLVPRE